jgi:predicted dehydrogenase
MTARINRRAFLRSTAGLIALAGLDLANLDCTGIRSSAYRPPRGANERINVAVLGLGMRGPVHIRNLGTSANCRIVYVCDADTARAQAAIDHARESNGGVEPKFEQDFRRILDDREVDVVTIAMPNHWHSPMAMWAMLAGKDVYVEKPLSHDMSEGRRVIEIAKQTRQVCQHGSQMRSNPGIMDAIEYLRSGALGRIQVSRGLCYKPRPSIGKVSSPQSPPSTVDYDLWCGPGPLAPIMRKKFHYDWHWFWDFGNGDIGNQGIHEIDLARWALGTDAAPKSVLTAGGRFGYDDNGQTPNTVVSSFDYGNDQPRLIVEVRGLPTKPFHTNGVENVVECEHGFLVSPSYAKAVAYDRDGNILKTFEGGGDANHFNNFLSVVRSRRMNDLHAPAIEGQRSCALLHMANISYRLGMDVAFETSRPETLGDPYAIEAIRRMKQHLLDDKVKLDDWSFMLGRRLQIDESGEKFVKDDQANQMRASVYRAPYSPPKSFT